MPRKALVVDSDYFFVEFLSTMLEKRGYQVCKAYDGKQGIASLEEGPFDIMFADLVIPKVSGRQLFRSARRKFNGHCCP
ncbi:MAG TPA: response regulator, partial [Desulfobacterales bacterium]|nr:response regulator [Desulfobacterales bacterium]